MNPEHETSAKHNKTALKHHFHPHQALGGPRRSDLYADGAYPGLTTNDCPTTTEQSPPSGYIEERASSLSNRLYAFSVLTLCSLSLSLYLSKWDTDFSKPLRTIYAKESQILN